VLFRSHLLRHAKTEQQSKSGKDFDRTLKQRGIEQSKEMALFLKLHDIRAIETWCSTAKRTRQTFSYLEDVLNPSMLAFMDDLYLCEHETFLQKLWKLNQSNDLFIIGHNDGLSDLASYFSDTMIHLSTCEYICFSFSADSWAEVSRGTGIIETHFRPLA
jgi:phosphohistidine phosphatase